MSEDRQVKTKRGIPPAATAAAPSTPPEEAVAAPDAPALPTPAQPPVAALPALPPRPPQANVGSFFSACAATAASLGAAQTAVAADVAALALEMSGLGRDGLTAAGDSVVAMLRARSLTDAVEIQLGFGRRSLDAVAGAATRLGEIGLRLANDATKPLLGRFAAG